MPQRIIRGILAFFVLVFTSAIIAFAQPRTPPDAGAVNNWQVAQSAGPRQDKLFIITIDQPHRRKTCHIRSFTPDSLVCSRIIGGPRIYRPQQVLALILPGDHGLKVRFVLGLNGALAAAIWGTVVLTATCPACAVATGIAALMFFSAAGAVLIGDEQPDRLLYLAPGHRLTGKFRSLQP